MGSRLIAHQLGPAGTGQGCPLQGQSKRACALAMSGASKSVADDRIRLIFVTGAMLLPTLSLVPLGGLYLWSHGLLLWWGLAALAITSVGFLLQKSLVRGDAVSSEPGGDSATPPEVNWNPKEEAAWQDVKVIAAGIDIDRIDSSQAIVELAHRTVNAVAERLHPQRADALWQFTLPEALQITESVSMRLRSYIVGSIPFGDRMTVAQFIGVYRWRHVASFAERAYDLWRLARIVNPATAATNEARERLSRAMLQWGREHVLRGLAETFVEEIGRAAIELYGGRLKLQTAAAKAPRLPVSPVETIELLIAGGNAVTRAEIYARLQSARAKAGSRDAFSPRLSFADAGERNGIGRLVAEISAADVVLLAPPQSLAGAKFVAEAVEKTIMLFRGAQTLVAPPVIRIDSDAASSDRSCSRIVEEALAAYPALAVDGLHLAASETMSSTDGQDQIWSAVLGCEPQARKVHVLREIEARKRAPTWAAAGKQALSAAGGLAGSVLSRLPLRTRWK